MKSTKITDSLFLVEQPLAGSKPELTQVREKTSWFFIYDRSGSMWGKVDKVVEDFIREAQKLPDGDILNIGWFSSRNEFGWICKGLSVSENRDAIPSMLRKYNTALNMTCFSDIILDTKKVIDDQKAITKNVNMLFATDGDDNQDSSKVMTALAELASSIAVPVFVGYGEYYNRSRLAQMAQAVGGAFLHASDLQAFSQHLFNFRENSISVEPKVEIDLPVDAKDFLFTFTDKGQVSSYATEPKVYLSSGTKAVYYFSEKPVGELVAIEELTEAVYAGAIASLQAGNVIAALELLSSLGDVNFVNRINNSFTNEEYGGVEKRLSLAIEDKKARFLSGVKKGCLPDENAVCMLDLLEALRDDETAKFLPEHPSFSYKRIGRPSIPESGYPEFNRSSEVQTPTSSLVWNAERLNLSVLVSIPGTVELGDDAEAVGLNKSHDCKIYRTYTIIADGYKNVTKLPVVNLSETTFNLMRSATAIPSTEKYDFDKVYVLDFNDSIPVINRAIAKKYTDLSVVFDLVLEQKRLEADNKTCNSVFKTFDESVQSAVLDVVKPTTFTDAQLQYLEKYGVSRDNSFNPPSKAAEPTDYYPVKLFTFDVEGVKSLPSLKDVVEKLEKNKKAAKPKPLTPSQQLIGSAYENYLTSTDGQSDGVKAVWVKDRLERNRKELRKVNAEINRAKFAGILGKVTFDQIPVPEPVNQVKYKDTTFLVEIKDTTVPL